MPPGRVGKYEIKREIGGNERGQVFEAYDPSSNRTVALKMIESQSLFTLTGQKKFSTQLAALMALSHPYILPIIDYGDQDNHPFIVMPLMEGNLTQKIQKGPLEVVPTLDMFLGLANALDYAGANGVFHQDLKPNNILFDIHGHPFIGDIGIVQVIDSLSAAKSPQVNPYYVSPEQVRRRKLTIQSQEYSLAALLFHALTGEVLFQGATDLVASFKHTSERPRDIHKLRPELSEAFNAVMARAFKKEPVDRFASSTEFIQSLIKANGGMITPEQARAAAPVAPLPQPAARVVARKPVGMPPPAIRKALGLRGLLAIIIATTVCICGALNFLLLGSDLP